MIRLNQLLKEETFTATNKQSGKTSVFKSKDSRDAAIKAGTHDAMKDKEQPKSEPKVAGSDMFGGDYAKDRGSETPKVEPNTASQPKSDMGVDKVATSSTEKVDSVIKGLKPASYGGKYPDSMESGGSLYRINKKGDTVRDREVRLKDITPEDITTTEKLFGVDLSKGIENGLDYETNDLIIQTKRLQQFQKGGEFENQKAYDSLLDTIKSGIAKNFNKKIQAADKKKSSAAKYPNKSDDPTYWKDERKYYDDDEDDDVEKTSDRLDKVETALEDELNLRGNGFETTRESSGGQGRFEGPMTIIDKNSDYDNGYNCLSIGSGENDGKFSIVFSNQDGEPIFDDEDYGSLTGNKVLSAREVYKIGKALMGMSEVQKFIKGEMTSDEFEAVHAKIKNKLNKSANEGMIRLTKIMEAGPCWKGYKQVGMKDKNGREVPNCVPEGVVNELGGISSIHKLYLAVSENHRKLKADQLAMAKKYNNETDPAKKAKLMDMLKKGTEKLRTVADNLSGVEERYIMSIDKDAELDLNPF